MAESWDDYEYTDFEPEKKRGRKKKGAGADVAADVPHVAPVPGLDRELARLHLNDYGNGQRLKRRYGNELISVPENGWLAWDRIRWNGERGFDEACCYAHKTALGIWNERRAFLAEPGKGVDVEEYARRLARHAQHSGNAGAVAGMLTAAAPYLHKPLALLDANPLLCPCTNGTLELGAESIFRESRREDYTTRCLGTVYEPGARCELFLKFLRDIIEKEEMRDFLQRIFGYCLSGLVREQVFFMFYGTGNNGKSTLMNVVRHVLGDFAMASPVSTFLAKREGNSGADASPDLARLPGARLVTAAEPPDGARLDEGRVKELTGGDPITARHLHKGFFSFVPVFKVVMVMNHLPTIRGVDVGIWRRIRVVPFTVEIPESAIDRTLEARLLAEAPGILQWMIRGFESYMHIGLAPPDSAIAFVSDYRSDQDVVGEFLRECCVMTSAIDPQTGAIHETGAKEMRAVYKTWCAENGLEMMSPRALTSKLMGRGIKRRRSHGAALFQGVVVKASWTEKL